MNTKALQQAIRVLRTVPDHLFDMHVYATDTDCGTTACIAGHCALDPWFQAQGLILICDPKRSRYPTYNGETDLIALAFFFQLNETTARRLFLACAPQTPREAIAHIETILATGTLPE